MKKTALHAMHTQAGARMVSFADYEMPVQYAGIKTEHLHTREHAGLFDVSHMGQIIVRGSSAAVELEQLVPLDLESLAIGRQCYTFFTLENGGILDDLIIARIEKEAFFLVVNASRKEADLAHLKAYIKKALIQVLDNRSLLALQGPQAEQALTRVFPPLEALLHQMDFMMCCDISVPLEGSEVLIRLCRSGYTGEDGFELSVANEQAALLAKALLADTAVEWVGLGARDSLRLEAGLCLYGHDLDESTSPVEAKLSWSIHKTRRPKGDKAGGFIGAAVIDQQLNEGVSCRRTGYLVEGKAPVREGAILVNANNLQRGRVTSGGFAPSLSRPVLMAYVDVASLEMDEALFAEVRGKRIPVTETKMPFIARN